MSAYFFVAPAVFLYVQVDNCRHQATIHPIYECIYPFWTATLQTFVDYNIQGEEGIPHIAKWNTI